MANLKSNRAFVLLYAVLVASVVLAIGFSLANIITKQIILSSLGQSSRVAYYAADGGRDCGLFWSNSDSFTGAQLDENTQAHCGKDVNDITSITDLSNQNPAELDLLNLYGIKTSDFVTYSVYRFSPLDFSIDSQSACAKVTVFTFEDGSAGENNPNYRTIVLSRGFNTACTSSAGNRTVSRTVINTNTW